MNDTRNTNLPGAPQFSLKTLLFLVLLVSMALGWWADHTRLQRDLQATAEAVLYGKRKLVEEMRRPGVVGTSLSRFPEVQKYASREYKGSQPPSGSLWHTGKTTGTEYTGYYIETNPAERSEGHPGTWVWTLDGEIVLVEPVVMPD